MAVFLSPIGNGAQYFTTGGLPLNGGFLNTYQAGTTTPQATFTTSAGNVANPVSIPLGIDGRPPAEIWLTDGIAYKFILTDSLGAVIAIYDNISGIGSGFSANLAAATGATLVGVAGGGTVQSALNGKAALGANADITSLSGLTTALSRAQGGTGNTTGSVTSISPTAGIGYATGAGGAVTQLTSKQTAVTLNKICGQITVNNAALTSGGVTNFTLNNSTIAATDVVLACVGSGATAGVYAVGGGNVAAGTCEIYIHNNGTISYSEAFVINFIVMKSVAA